MAEAKREIVQKDRPWNLYIVISAVIYAQLYILPTILAPGIFNIIPKEIYYDTIRPADDIIFFLIILPCFILRKPGLAPGLRPNSLYLSLHVAGLAVFAFYLARIVNMYPFPPLAPDSVLLRVFRVLNPQAEYLSGRFRVVYLFIAAHCHYFLLQAFTRVSAARKRIYPKYLFAMFLAFFFAEFSNLFRWERLSTVVARMELFLLNLAGLRTFFWLHPGESPVVGTDAFKVTVVYTCSGLEGMVYFWVAFTMVAVLEWERLKRARAVAVFFLGTLFMYTVNILRILLIILIGHFYDPDLAMGFFHDYCGTVLYLAAVLVIIGLTRGWMVEKKVEAN